MCHFDAILIFVSVSVCARYVTRLRMLRSRSWRGKCMMPSQKYTSSQQEPNKLIFWNPSLSLFLLIKAGYMVINQRICGDLNIDTRGVFFCVCCSSRLLKATSPNSTTRSSNSRPTFWRRYDYHIDYHMTPPILTKNWVASCSLFKSVLHF